MNERILAFFRRPPTHPSDAPVDAWWSVAEDVLFARLGTTREGLTGAEARWRLARRPGVVAERPPGSGRLFLQQFESPLVLLLLFAAVLSFALGDRTDGAIIVVILVASATLGWWQHRGAAEAVRRLIRTVGVKARVVRDGAPVEIPIDEVVAGDVALLAAGDAVPGDARLIEARDLLVVQSALTGETFPAEKEAGVRAADAPLAERANTIYFGTHVAAGEARAVVVRVGPDTEFGHISERLRLHPPETEFERGLKRFGWFLLQITLVLVLAIFAFNVALDRPLLDSFMFSLALAVGLTPQLLPVILSVNLSTGARRMARERAIVKRLSSIENLGSMTVLCCDKTGTLTLGEPHLRAALDPSGAPSARPHRLGWLNAVHQTGFGNPLDTALLASPPDAAPAATKIGEIPYDFARKRLSVLLDVDGERLLVTKGAVPRVLDACTTIETDHGPRPLAEHREAVESRVAELGGQGFRTIAVAVRSLGGVEAVDRADEIGLSLVGVLVFADPPKPDAGEAIEDLRRRGITVKMITGDAAPVSRHVATAVGLRSEPILTGRDLARMPTDALVRLARDVDVFAEIEPVQKERVLAALREGGDVVGFLGDGINDAPALHAADVGLSVDSAVDVAREAADIVLLDRNLHVVARGVDEGRRTFANTLKYVFMATSANFGNMFSMAGASLFLPFLPLLPKQVLLMNLLTDFPELALATDRVDPELVALPRRWDIRFIRRFMLVFGTLSSVFDYLTFGVLLWLLRAGATGFRSGWFVESVASAALVVLVVRSRRPLVRSRPGPALQRATLIAVAAAIVLPWTPLASPLGMAPLPAAFLPALGAIVLLYMISAEALKRWFYLRLETHPAAATEAR